MLRMADTYYDEDNYEKAYILYHKYVTLFIEKVMFELSSHQVTQSGVSPSKLITVNV